MIRAALFLLLFLPGCVPVKRSCSYQDVLDHLNLTLSNEVFRVTRPVLDYTRPTEVQLSIVLYSILALIEKTQTFIPFLWVHMTWTNERIRWDPAQFCGISQVTIPREMVWMPDLFIYEMTEKDSSPRNPYIVVFHNGTVQSEEDMKVVSSCKMCMRKFPFDFQRCNLTVGSAIHTADEVLVRSSYDAARITEFSKDVLWTQGEWEFKNVSIINHNFTYGGRDWNTLVYTFTVQRRPLLHVLNLLVPIMFLLILDLASFLVSDQRGEKLGFKVTVLLAISVLLLILNDILPSTSNYTPLIATYVIAVFGLMLLSILETILVTFLLDRSQRNQQMLQDERLNNWSRDDSSLKAEDGCNEFDQKQHELLCVSEVVTPESQVLAQILEQIRRLQRSVSAAPDQGLGSGGGSVWAGRINAAFFSLYVLVLALFLPFMYRQWSS